MWSLLSSLPPVCFDESLCSSCRRTLFQYGIRLPATRQPQPESGTRFGECLTYLPTPLWSTKPTPTASSTCWGGWGVHLPNLSGTRVLVGSRGIWSYRRLTCGEGTDQSSPLVLLATCSSSLLARLLHTSLNKREPFAESRWRCRGLLHFHRLSCLSLANHCLRVKDNVLFLPFLKLISLNKRVLPVCSFPTFACLFNLLASVCFFVLGN